MDKKTRTILAAACGKGREHDFRLYKRSGLRVPSTTELLGDSGYQGLTKLHAKSRTPHKRRRKAVPLTPEQKAFNHTLASERVLVENVIRRLKVFRVLKETYRHRRRRHGLRVHLLAGLYIYNLNFAEGLVTAWQHARNVAACKADWRFTTADARIKLKRLYPIILP